MRPTDLAYTNYSQSFYAYLFGILIENLKSKQILCLQVFHNNIQ